MQTKMLVEFRKHLRRGKSFILECQAHAPYDGCFWTWTYMKVCPGEKRPLKTVTDAGIVKFGRQFVLEPIYAAGEVVKQPRGVVFGDTKRVNAVAGAYAMLTPVGNAAPVIGDSPTGESFADDAAQEYMRRILLNGMLGVNWKYDTFSFYPIDDELHESVCEHFWEDFAERVDGFVWRCSSCQKLIADEVPEFTSYHGVGGTAVQSENPVCSECRLSGSCSHCGEYCGQNELDWRGRCEYCNIFSIMEMLESNTPGDLPDELYRELKNLYDTTQQLSRHTQELCRLKPHYSDRYVRAHCIRETKLKSEIAKMYDCWRNSCEQPRWKTVGRDQKEFHVTTISQRTLVLEV